MWQLGLAGNLVVMALYAAIAWSIGRPLVATGQLRTNRLGVATAVIFATCAIGHGVHAFHLFGPTIGVDAHVGDHARGAMEWHLVVVDAITASVAVVYWRMRRSYASFIHGAKLFDDLEERKRAALEINDEIIQRLVVAQMAIEGGDDKKASDMIRRCVRSAQSIVTEILVESDISEPLATGKIIRSEPLSVRS